MRVAFLMVTVLGLGCAAPGFHAGRSSLVGPERNHLQGKGGSPSAVFRRFWQTTPPKSWGMIRWDSARSWAVPSAPPDLLQSIRDEVGRLNQRAPAREDVTVSVTVYDYEPQGYFAAARCKYELVVRDKAGKVVWAADDEIWPGKALAMSLVDTNAAIIGREELRKIRDQFGIQDSAGVAGSRGAAPGRGRGTDGPRGVRGEAPRGFGATGRRLRPAWGGRPFWPGGPAIPRSLGLPCDQGCSPLPSRLGLLPPRLPACPLSKP